MINTPTNKLPLESEAAAHCTRLTAFIRQDILTNGPMPFSRFMELALYAPGLGYYTAGSYKIGKGGDFTTAPEISELYSQSIANQCYEILQHCPGDILECGAGTGKMAAAILLELERLQSLPDHYYILELSADLKQRQQAFIKKQAQHLFNRVTWLDTLDNLEIEGIVLANELLDAFPVHLFKCEADEVKEYYVDIKEDDFIFKLGVAQFSLSQYLATINVDFPEGYTSECNLYIAGWMKSISHVLQKGILLLVDYGFARGEYYHPERNQGTLMCHYQQRAHPNPLINVGLQDITAHVDFTTVAEAGESAELKLVGYTNQASFLLACGITDYAKMHGNEKDYLNLANQIKLLTLPSEMGELFKVIAFSKKLDEPLKGFAMRNMLEKL